MNGNVWRPAHLTSEQMEERRLAAAALLRQGRLSQAQIARQLGVSRASVSRWAATLAQEGRRGLAARVRTGRPPRLDPPVWVGSWTGARWRQALPLNAGPSNASPP
jgi:transposase